MRLRMRIPTRARTSGSLLDLPEEVVLLILKCFTANELMCLRTVGIQSMRLFDGRKNMFSAFFPLMRSFAWPLENSCSWTRSSFIKPLNVRSFADFILCISSLQVCSRLKHLIDDSSSLWLSASFLGVWPSRKNLPLLQRFVIVSCNGIQLFCASFEFPSILSRAQILIFTFHTDWWGHLFSITMGYKIILVDIYYFFLFYRAANLGNPEALIKLGLAHLYNEGSKWLVCF